MGENMETGFASPLSGGEGIYWGEAPCAEYARFGWAKGLAKSFSILPRWSGSGSGSVEADLDKD